MSNESLFQLGKDDLFDVRTINVFGVEYDYQTYTVRKIEFEHCPESNLLTPVAFVTPTDTEIGEKLYSVDTVKEPADPNKRYSFISQVTGFGKLGNMRGLTYTRIGHLD